MPDLLELEKEIWVEEDKDAGRDKPKFGRKPPKDGPCKRCGQDRPLNRLFLCYACWVKTELEKKGWREGESHPFGCSCDMTADHETPGGPRG